MINYYSYCYHFSTMAAWLSVAICVLYLDAQAEWILITSGCLSILFCVYNVHSLEFWIQTPCSFLFVVISVSMQNHWNQSPWLYHIELSLSCRASYLSTFNTLLRLCTVLYLYGWGWMVDYWSLHQSSSNFNAASCSLRTQWLSCPVHNSRKAKLDGFYATLSFFGIW